MIQRAEIIPNLGIRNGREAVAFYQAAFGAVVEFQVGGPKIFAALRIGDARLFLADAAPEFGNYSPDQIGGSAVRINLLVDDPDAVHAAALAAGATEVSPVRDEEAGPRMGVVRDPFGHTWLIGAHWDPANDTATVE